MVRMSATRRGGVRASMIGLALLAAGGGVAHADLVERSVGDVYDAATEIAILRPGRVQSGNAAATVVEAIRGVKMNQGVITPLVGRGLAPEAMLCGPDFCAYGIDVGGFLVFEVWDRSGPQSMPPGIIDRKVFESGKPFAAMLPVSARTGDNLERLVAQIFEHLPVGPKQFPDGMVTDRDLAFRIGEVIREKLMTLVHKEVPYGLTVEVEHLGRNEEGQRLVHALIWLERESQKKIVIGKAGSVLKEAGTLARQELRELLGERVHLELWVKVREHWADNERELQRLGFEV